LKKENILTQKNTLILRL